jgi:anti-sigma regulatory factor (Ser/Thr protein kinase)
MGAPGGRLELTLRPAPDSVAVARRRLLEALGPTLAADERHTLKLLVSELVTNAIRHGGSREPVELSVYWDGEVRVEVVDHGDGFLPRPRAGDLEDPGGFGLFLVGRLADRWGVETDGATRVWFVLDRVGRAA